MSEALDRVIESMRAFSDGIARCRTATSIAAAATSRRFIRITKARCRRAPNLLPQHLVMPASHIECVLMCQVMPPVELYARGEIPCSVKTSRKVLMG